MITRCLIALRQRLGWLLAVVVLVAALTVLAVQRVQPMHRVTATLSVEEPVPQSQADSIVVTSFARDRVAARHESVLARLDVDEILANPAAAGSFRGFTTPALRAAQLRSRIVADVTDASLVEGTGGDPGIVSIIYTIATEDSEPRVATSTLEAVLSLYAEPADDPALRELNEQLTAQTRATEERTAEIARLENAIAEFRSENSGALGEASSSDSRAAAVAESALIQLNAEIEDFQARSVSVDRALRELDPRGTLRRQVSEPGPASSERLANLQTVLALLSGRLGSSHPEVQQLQAETDAVRFELEREADSAVQDLQAAQTEYERLQALYPLDYPDVVRMANIVSGLERTVDEISAVGLTAGEIRYIESLVREEQALQVELGALRAERDALRANLSDLQTRAASTPLLLEQYQALAADLEAAQAGHAAALDGQRVLEVEYAAALQRNAPPVVLSGRPYQSVLVATTRVSTIVGIAGLAGSILLIVVLIVVERIDRRVVGARALTAIYGRRPLAEIPMIPNPSLASARGA